MKERRLMGKELALENDFMHRIRQEKRLKGNIEEMV